MYRNFTYVVVGQSRRLKSIQKKCSSNNKCHFIFAHANLANIVQLFRQTTYLKV
jgi:hypothetical protein